MSAAATRECNMSTSNPFCSSASTGSAATSRPSRIALESVAEPLCEGSHSSDPMTHAGTSHPHALLLSLHSLHALAAVSHPNTFVHWPTTNLTCFVPPVQAEAHTWLGMFTPWAREAKQLQQQLHQQQQQQQQSEPQQLQQPQP